MNNPEKKIKILHDFLLAEKPEKVDAIIWLQGDRFDRALKTFELYKNGWSKRIIISGNNILIGQQTRPGEKNISLDEMKKFLLKKGVKKNDLIVDDGAMNTKEQAQHILKIAKKNKWSKIILVGSSYYQPRAFLTFLKEAEQVKWKGKIINQPAVIAWSKKPAGRDATAEIIFKQEFEKIKEYKKDLVSIEKGIKYLSARMIDLRRVEKKDAGLLFKLANEPEARANATDSKSIDWQGHLTWFTAKIVDVSAHIYVLTNFQEDFGVVRFEKKKNYFIISYAIDKKHRGKGLGFLMLEMGMREICQIEKKPVFVGYVKEGNIASEKIFSRLGFSIRKKEIIKGIKFNIYQSKK